MTELLVFFFFKQKTAYEMRRRGVPITPARVENFVQTRAAQEGYVAGQVAAVERALATPGNERLGAPVNTETGDVAGFVAPPPGRGRPDDAPAPGRRRSPARRPALQPWPRPNPLSPRDDMSS